MAMQTKYPKEHQPTTRPLVLFLCLLGLTAFACAALPILPPPRITPTPTGQINAIEAGTPAPPVDKKNWQVWHGTIVSQTSRQFMSNGSLVDTCKTDWNTELVFTVNPSGTISGVGGADLTAGPQCTPLARPGNTTYMLLSVDGLKDAKAISLKLGVSEIQPMPSGDFGGYALLDTNGACPPVMQALTVPMTGAGAAHVELDLSAVMTGCAGSKDDRMSNQSQVSLELIGKCIDNPFGPNDPNAKICE